MTTPNPWIRYVDVLTIIEKIADASSKGKRSTRSGFERFYFDVVEEIARTMSVDLADLVVTTPQPPSAEMVEVRTLARVIDYIDMLIENALSGPSKQVQAGKLWGLKTLRAELRKQQDNPLGD